MKHILIIFSIFLFSFTIISCSSSSDDGDSTTSDNTTTTNDTTSPVIAEVTVVTTPTSDPSPDYTFSTTKEGTITYGGSCSSGTTSATSGNNTITFLTLSDGSYSDCTIIVTDSDGNASNTLTITPFTVDTTTPSIEQVTVVTTPTNDSTPNYTFSSSEAGTITYGGSCSSSTTSAISGNNTITLVSLSEGTYSNCTIKVTDSAGNISNTLTITSFTVDLSAATLVEVTVVTTPTNDNTPDHTFSSSEAGTITYGGSCSSSTTSATTDNNTITLASLSDGTYSNCTITVTDNSSNSVTLNISSFVIDTTAPTVSSISPTDNQSYVSKSDNISLTFSESMEVSSVTTNTSNTTCSGTLRVSSDNFSTCVQMSSTPTVSNSNKTFTINPNSNLSLITNYLTRVTTVVKDVAGNTLSSQYQSSYGFTTNVFVAVGENGVVLISSDLINWTASQISTGTLSAPAFGNGILLTRGPDGLVYTSSNGQSWTTTQLYHTDGSTRAIGNPFFLNNIFIVFLATGKAGTSSDGVNWTRTGLTYIQHSPKSLIYSDSKYIGAGLSGISTSTDAETWTTLNPGFQGGLWDITYGNGKYVVVGCIYITGTTFCSGDIGSSADLSSWSRHTIPISDTTTSSVYTNGCPPILTSVIYEKDIFVAVGYTEKCDYYANIEDEGNIYTSTNGTSWTERNDNSTSRLFSVTYANSTFTVVGNSGTNLTSSDGITWTSRTSGVTANLGGISSTE